MASIQLKDLVPGKNYKVKVRAKFKGEDPGKWSKILNFKAPIKSKNDDDDTLNSKYGIVVGSKKDPKRGYIVSSNFNGKISLKNGITIDDDKNNNNIGTAGWAIDHKGNAVLNNLIARGQLIIDLNNNQGRMYFGENIPAFGTDKADGIKLDTYNYWFRAKSVTDKRPTWRVGDENSFVSYNPDSNSANGKLIVSGQIQAGLGTSNQVLLGANVGGAGIAGIKIDDSNFWYDADKVTSGPVFKVSGANTTAITVSKAGRVIINSDHSGGRITGRITINLDESAAPDKFVFGKDVISAQDGIKLNTHNYWTLTQGSTPSARFKIGNSTKYVIWDGSDLTISAQLQVGVGTNNTVIIGPNAGGTNNNGIKIDNNNFWYDPDKVSAGTPVFKVSGVNNNTAISVAKDGDIQVNVDQTGGKISGNVSVTGSGAIKIPFYSNKNILIGKNVSGTNDGIILDSNNYWYVSNSDGSTFGFRAGGALSNYLSFSGGVLTVNGSINVTGGTAATNASVDEKIASISVRQRLNNEVTGVEMLATGAIKSLGKTYDSATAGWILEYNAGNPRFLIGDDTNYMRWNGSNLEIFGGVIKTKDGNSYIQMGSNALTGVKDGQTMFLLNAETGTAEFRGKVKSGSKIENSTTIGDSQVGGSPIEVTTATPTAVGDPTSIPTSMGLKVGQSIFITGDLNNGNISLLRNRNGINDLVGGIIDSKTSKYADTGSGIGMLLGLSNGYPFIEVGYDTYDESTGARTGPRIRLMGSSTAYITLNASNFGLVGGSSSFITVPDGTAPDKYLTKKNGYLIWAPPPSGGGGTTTTLALGTNLANNLLGLSLSGSEYTLSLDGQAANLVFAGPLTGDSAPTFRSLVSNDIIGALTAGTGILFTNANNKITINNSGYTNATATVNSNKITYSASPAPLTGRTEGDIHFVF